MPFGLDPTLGFVKRTTEDLLAQLEADEIAEISPSLDVSSTSPIGQLNGAFVKPLAEVWDLAEAVYAAQDPDKATGDGQDALCALTGTAREPATRSQVAVSLTLGAAVTVPQDSLVAVLGNSTAVFKLVGLEPAPGFPVVHADVTSVGAGTYIARFEAVDTGVVAANAGTLTVIVTPITGWTAATNATDAALGHDIETNSALRIRRDQELDALGSTPVDALRAELYSLLADNDIVGFVDVVENTLDTVDADGRDPNSIEALIDDGPSPIANNEIAQVIWDGRAGGIKTFGSTSGTAIDDLGLARTQNFNRPTAKPVYFAVSIVIDSVIFPADGDLQIKLAMVAHGQTLKPGEDVARNSFMGPIFSIAGVQNVTVLHLGFAATPTLDADLVIAVRERATFDTSRITITHV